MNRIHRDIDSERETPAIAAARWFARRRRGLRGYEKEEFTGWLEMSSENRRAYDDVTRSWELAFDAASDPEVVAMRSAALMLRPERRRTIPIWGGLIAAMLVILVSVGIYFFSSVQPSNPPLIAVAKPRILQTAVGERASVTLDDGSIVTLNTNSKVQVAFSEKRRDVTLLKGQAFFQVAKDKAHPFIVTAGDREVIAVGTEFEVGLEMQGVRVALVEGRVNVRKALPGSMRLTDAPEWPVEQTMLEPGEQLFAATTGTVSVKPVKVAELLSWREGRVRFDDTPLSEAVAEMNRYSKSPITIADPHIADLKISGAFRTGQPKSFVTAITEVFPVRADVKPDGIMLRSALR